MGSSISNLRVLEEYLSNVGILPFSNPDREIQFKKNQLSILLKLFAARMFFQAVKGLALGYYVVNAYYIFKNEFEEEVQVSPLCPQCKVNNFQIICKSCCKVVSCRECYAKMEECPSCSMSIKLENNIRKVYMA